MNLFKWKPFLHNETEAQAYAKIENTLYGIWMKSPEKQTYEDILISAVFMLRKEINYEIAQATNRDDTAYLHRIFIIILLGIIIGQLHFVK